MKFDDYWCGHDVWRERIRFFETVFEAVFGAAFEVKRPCRVPAESSFSGLVHPSSFSRFGLVCLCRMETSSWTPQFRTKLGAASCGPLQCSIWALNFETTCATLSGLAWNHQRVSVLMRACADSLGMLRIKMNGTASHLWEYAVCPLASQSFCRLFHLLRCASKLRLPFLRINGRLGICPRLRCWP